MSEPETNGAADAPPPDEWGIVEMMGHVKMAGRISEVERFGSKLGRCDIPQADGGFVTRLFNGGSLYRYTPCSESAARAVAVPPTPAYQYTPLLGHPDDGDGENGDDDLDDDGQPL